MYTINLQLWTTCYVWEAGHALRITVTSSNSPRFSVNRNNGLDVHQGGPLLNATNTVYFGASTFVDVPFVELAAFPKINPLLI